MSDFTVKFMPWGQAISVGSGHTVLDAALKAGVPLEHACGGCCSCTTCHIEIIKSTSILDEPDCDEHAKLEELPKRTPHTRLACQTVIESDLEVHIPSATFPILT